MTKSQCQGFGNRLGWVITAMAVAETLDRPLAVLWEPPCDEHHSDLDTVLKIVSFPPWLRLTDEANTSFASLGGAWLPSDQPGSHASWHDATESWVLYFEETGWREVERWKALGLCEACSALTAGAFSQSYRSIQRHIAAPNLSACLPEPRSFMVVHLRRGDRGNVSEARNAELFGAIDQIHAIRQVVANGPSLRWLVAAEEHTEEVDRMLAHLDRTAGLLQNDMRVQPECALRATRPPPLRAASGASAEALQPAVASGLMPPAESGWTERLHSSDAAPGLLLLRTAASPDNNGSTLDMLADFFAIHRAAGVVVSCPVGETSFSTVAALAGGAPLLFPFSIHDETMRVSRWLARENAGERPTGAYFREHLTEFVTASGALGLAASTGNAARGKGE